MRRAFSPLQGFMSEQQYTSVVQNMRLPVRCYPRLRNMRVPPPESCC